MVDLPAIGPKDKVALAHALDTGADLIAAVMSELQPIYNIQKRN